MGMNDNTIVILNSVSILFLLAFVSYASYRAEELSNAIWGVMLRRQSFKRISALKYDFIWYAIIIIVLTLGVIQISQTYRYNFRQFIAIYQKYNQYI